MIRSTATQGAFITIPKRPDEDEVTALARHIARSVYGAMVRAGQLEPSAPLKAMDDTLERMTQAVADAVRRDRLLSGADDLLWAEGGPVSPSGNY